MPVTASNCQVANPRTGITRPGTATQGTFPANDLTGTYALPSGTPEKDFYSSSSTSQSVQVYGASGAISFVTESTSDDTNYVQCGSATSGYYCIDTGSGVKKTVRLRFTAAGTAAVILYGSHT